MVLREEEDMKWKMCNACGIEYPHIADYFHRETTVKSGLRATCKSCECARVRSKYGTHPVAKLNAIDVREIKRLLKTPLNQVIIAKIFEVSPSLISKIKSKEVWGYVVD